MKDPNVHLSGIHVVQIRPWSIVQLNPENIPLCYESIPSPLPNSMGLSESLKNPTQGQKPLIQIPIMISGTSPWRLTVNWKKSFDSSESETKSIDLFIENPSDSTKSQYKHIISLSENDGYFYISQFIDGNFTQGRIIGGGVTINRCPELRLDGFLLKAGKIDICSAPKFPIKFWIKDFIKASPYFITLEALHEQFSKEIKLDEIYLSSELENTYQGFSKFTYELNPLDFILDPIDHRPNFFHECLLRIKSIRDANGHTRFYGQWQKGDALLLNIYSPPTIKWDPKFAIKNYESSDKNIYTIKLLSKTDGVNIPLLIEGNSPFKYTIAHSNGHLFEFENIKSKSIEFNAGLPGIYILNSICDRFCTGNCDLNSQINVIQVDPPTIKSVKMNSITSSCGKVVGISMNLSMTGEYPWTIKARYCRKPPQISNSESKIIKFNNYKSKEENGTLFFKANSSFFVYEWKPVLPGEYDVEIVGISDQNFKDVKITNHDHFKQIITPESRVTFKSYSLDLDTNGPKSSELFVCKGESAKIKIYLTGVGPWETRYVIKHPDGVRSNHKILSKFHTDEIILSDNILNFDGKYEVIISSLTDSDGCLVNIEEGTEKFHINVLRDRPSVSFKLHNDGSNIYYIREGNHDIIPILVNSSSGLPIAIELEFIPQDSTNCEIITKNINIEPLMQGIMLNLPGKYTIRKISDGYCSGIPGKNNEVVVQTIYKPSVTFSIGSDISKNTDFKNSEWLCSENRHESSIPVSVKVFGSGSVKLEYTVQYSVELDNLNKMKLEKRTCSGVGPLIQLDTIESIKKPGYYRYQIKSISDSKFPYQNLEKKSIEFIQQILPSPKPIIKYPESNNDIHNCSSIICLDPSIEDESFAKIGPFHLDYVGSELRGTVCPSYAEIQVLSENNVPIITKAFSWSNEETKTFDIDIPIMSFKVGKYYLKVLRVVNTFGCTWISSPKVSILQGIEKGTICQLEITLKPRLNFLPMSLRESHTISNDTIKDGASSSDQYFCVGDIAKIELEGDGPWTVKYSLHRPNGELISRKKDEVNIPILQILLAESGVFSIDSICNKYCCSDFNLKNNPMAKTKIFDLPSAIILDGSQVLRDGEKSYFSVLLKDGQAPFSFTYERRDEVSGEILDNIDVQNLDSGVHKIEVSSGGIFKVTSVKSRHCSYPPKPIAI